jgi:urease accessory protein
MKTRTWGRAGVALAVLLGTGAAVAHPGHGAASLAEGLAHPFGIDHLLAMVAVGVWSAAALPAGRRWAGPASFLAAMTMGAALAMAGLALPLVGGHIEAGVAASLLVFGAMLVFTTRVPMGAGLALIAAAASLHGFAHGAELPLGASATGYALGFLATTALLHAGGVGLGLALRQRATALMQATGALLGATGLVLLATRL